MRSTADNTVLRRGFRLKPALLAGCAAGVMTALAGAAQAQDDAEDGAYAGDTVIVTGSRIRGIDPVGSDVIAIGQDEISTTPTTTTADLLRRLPQVVSLGPNANGGSAQNGAANVTRGAGINLRGIGVLSTLLLVEGRRIPAAGTQGQFTDPSIIPSIAIDRVEVIADGASAIYGSDAVAGVVNFNLRKNFEGVEVRGRYGLADGGYDEWQVAGIFGHNWDTGRIMIAAEHTENSVLEGSDRDWYRNDLTEFGGRDLRSTECAPGTLYVNGTSYAIPAGGLTAANVGDLAPGTVNRCDNEQYNSLIPSQKRNVVTLSASQDLGERVRVFTDGYYYKRNFTLRGNGGSAGETFQVVIPNTNPYFVSPDPLATSVTVGYSLIPEAGISENDGFGEVYNITGGVEADLFADWRGEFYYSHGHSEDLVDRRFGVNSGALNAAAADTNPATALNVFGGPNNPATLAAIRDRLFVIQGESDLDVFNLQFDGSLFALPGGEVRLAVGGEYREEGLSTDLEIGSSAASIHVIEAGKRNVKAGFYELYVPLVGASNRMPGVETLNLSVAGRYESYSNFGSTFNPKVGLTWEPFETLAIKGSWGTSFRAPTFAEIFTRGAGAGLYGDTLPDPTAPTGLRYGIGIAGGNPDLEPEEAETWSVGFDYQPDYIEGLTIGATYWSIHYTNQILALRGTPGLLTNPIYAPYVNLNPTQAEIDALINSGAPINSPINAANVTFIADGRRQNLGVTNTSGIDFNVGYNYADFDFYFNGAYLTKLETAVAPGAPLTDVLNTINNSQKFRFQGGVGWSPGAVRALLTVNHLSGYLNNTVSPAEDIDAYTTVDAYLGYEFDFGLTAAIDVRNLFDQDPPYVNTTFGYDAQSANPIGRLVSFTLTQRF
jgi:iron complex outermembrane recepter protein